MERVFHERLRILRAVEPRDIRVVFREKHGRVLLEDPAVIAERRVRGLDAVRTDLPEQGTLGIRAPAPGIAEPQRRQDVDACCLRAAIFDRDADEHLLRGRLRVLGGHVEITLAVEHARVRQLILAILPRAACIFLAQLCVWKLGVRIFVERAEVGRRRRRVQIPVAFLHVLTVRALAICEAEEALL